MIKRGALLRRRTWAWVALGGALVAILALIDVQIIEHYVAVRWTAGIAPGDRAALERRYDLRNGEFDEGTTWRYELGDRSSENIRALIQDAAVDDTGYIDREALTAPDRYIRLTTRAPEDLFSDSFERSRQLLQFHQTAWLLLAGGVLLWTARASSERRRRNATVAALLLIGVLA